jgi:hypothetical protein
MMQGLSDLHIPEAARTGLAAEIMASVSQGVKDGGQAFMSITDQFGQKHKIEIEPDMDETALLGKME